jgi:S1-C subfamily serine protease
MAMPAPGQMQILKIFWRKRSDGVWAGDAIRGIDIKGGADAESDFFAVEDDLVLTQATPVKGIPFQGIGTVRSFMGASIVPIVAHVQGDSRLRCVGTGFFVSCTGLLITAAHVITDPIERKYGGVTEHDDVTWMMRNLHFGVLVPTNPVFQARGFVFYPFEWTMFLAEKRPHPIPFHGVDLKLNSDIAICKVPERTDGPAHQPLNVVQRAIKGASLRIGAAVAAIGYPAMQDVELTPDGNGTPAFQGSFDLFASKGNILEWLPDNATTNSVSTPGPCFSFEAKISGGMSGSPIFDREGIYVHGVVSKGLEGSAGPERLSFGSMLGPSMALPIARMNNKSLLQLLTEGNEGMAILSGPGL